MFERFDDGARRAVTAADEAAHAMGDTGVSTAHLLLGLLADEWCAEALATNGVPLERLRTVLLAGGEGAESPARIPFTRDGEVALVRSLREALQLGDNYIGAAHLLLAVLAIDGPARAALDAVDVDAAAARAAMLATRVPDIEPVRVTPRRRDRVGFRLEAERTTVDVGEMLQQLTTQLQRLESQVDRLDAAVDRLERRDA